MIVESYLNKTDSFASLGALLVRSKYGEEVVTWELETLWAEIDKETEEPFSDLAKVKLSAFLVMEVNPMCLWEVNTFQNTVLAARNKYPIPEIVQEASAIEIAWGMYEISYYLNRVGSINKNTKLSWSTDITGYIAACLKADGWLVAPGSLSFVQETLNSVNKNVDLVPAITDAWASVDKNFMLNNEIPVTDEISGQLRRLQEFYLYLSAKHKAFRNHIKTLSL